MAKSISLSNGRVWKTQAAAFQHFKGMLSRYVDEQNVDDAQDHDDLVALLERYDEVITDGPAKVGVGISCFFRRRNIGESWSSPSFWVRRTDGSETDFSYIQAVKGQCKGDSSDFYSACRAAVESDLLVAKRRFFAEHPEKNEHGFVPCEVCGSLITFELAHMDHAYPTFNQIVLMFRAARGWSHAIAPGVITPSQDGQSRATFIDPAIAQVFRDLHHAVAVLRVIDRKANLSMAGKQRVPKIKFPVRL